MQISLYDDKIKKQDILFIYSARFLYIIEFL